MEVEGYYMKMKLQNLDPDCVRCIRCEKSVWRGPRPLRFVSQLGNPQNNI